MIENRGKHGTIIASYGRRGLLRPDSGDIQRYMLKGRRIKAVCGDRVRWETQSSGEDALVTSIGERSNVLERPDHRGKGESLAVNLDQLLIVAAPEPTADFFIIDRFICAAELMPARAIIVWNKTDLASGTTSELAEYRELGYPVLETSVESGCGVDDLKAILGDGVSMLTGQSGVGKSSLVNTLVPNADSLTAALSDSSGEGRHTTTASYMHQLDWGGQLIDSPGIREFAPLIRDTRRVQLGFREVAQQADNCRFADCLHTREPNCAVQAALARGEISQRRYDSYKRLLNISRDQSGKGV